MASWSMLECHSRHMQRISLLIAILGVATLAHAGAPRADDAPLYPERFVGPLRSGALGRPFGESIVIQGKVVNGPYKGESGPEGRLLVQRVNGVATQEGLIIRFNPITPRETVDIKR